MEPLDYAPELRHNPLKPNKKRAEIAIYVFWAVIGIGIISILSSILQYNLLKNFENGADITDSAAEMNDIRETIVAVFQFIIYIASIFAFLYWFRRAYANLHRTEMVRPEHHDNWAIWSFVIPIISLWHPYKVMKEIWNKSQFIVKSIHEEYKIDRNTTAIGVWWAAYLISNFAGQINFRTSMDAETVPELIDVTVFQAVCNLIDIPAALVTLNVIKNVSKKEDDLYKAMGSLPVAKDENNAAAESDL